MAEQCYRGLEGHPTELARIREVAGKLSGSDQYQEEIGYSAEELAEAKRGEPFEADAGSKLGSNVAQPGVPPEGAHTVMVEAGVTSNNSPNANVNYPVSKGRRGY